MREHQLLDGAGAEAIGRDAEARVRAAVEVAEGTGPPATRSLTEDVYAVPPSGGR